jgi:hypothetical protein
MLASTASTVSQCKGPVEGGKVLVQGAAHGIHCLHRVSLTAQEG